jgi:hypothetical protein
MAYRDQPFVGAVSADSILKTNFIIGSGNFASASNLIADFAVSSGDESLLRVGQTIYSVGGVVPTNAVITNINGNILTMDMTASAAAAGDTIGISLPSGSYLFQSASFTDPNNELTVGDITGSDTASFDYAVLGVAKRNNATRNNVFHIYEISEVVQTNVGSSEISFFVEWGEEGTEADSGDILQTAETTVALVNLTDTGSIAPGFSRAISGLENIKDGSEYAGFNIAISQYLSDLSGSGGSGTTATGSFTGSFTGSLLGDVLGTASIADFATTASYISTASFADTATTASLATSASYAETSSIHYDSGSGTITGLDEIKINDFDDNVGVTFQDSKLTLTFGAPTVPSITSFFNSGFDTDRFNKVEDASIVTGNWSNGGYTFVSASILTGSVTLSVTVDAGDTNMTLAQTTSGSQRYTLIYTGSSPLDGSEYKLSSTVTSTLSKSNPGAPSISDTVTIQLGDTSNQFEQGATGSIVFSSAYGSSNGWDQVSLVNTPTNTPIEVTGSVTGSTSISIQSVASYESPTGENDPQSTTSRTTTRTFSKIRSVRYGASSATSFTQTEIEDLGAWDTTLGGSIGTIDKGNTNPSGDTITITWSGDKYQYIIYDSSRSDLSGISTSGFGVIGQFTKSTVGDYTVYRTTALQAGGAGSSITYNLT